MDHQATQCTGMYRVPGVHEHQLVIAAIRDQRKEARQGPRDMGGERAEKYMVYLRGYCVGESGLRKKMQRVKFTLPRSKMVALVAKQIMG